MWPAIATTATDRVSPRKRNVHAVEAPDPSAGIRPRQVGRSQSLWVAGPSDLRAIGCSAGSPPRTDSAGKSLAGSGGTILFYDEFYDKSILCSKSQCLALCPRPCPPVQWLWPFVAHSDERVAVGMRPDWDVQAPPQILRTSRGCPRRPATASRRPRQPVAR